MGPLSPSLTLRVDGLWVNQDVVVYMKIAAREERSKIIMMIRMQRLYENLLKNTKADRETRMLIITIIITVITVITVKQY